MNERNHEMCQELLLSVLGLVTTAAKRNNITVDHIADAHDQMTISADRWCDEMVAVTVEDWEAKALKLVFLTGNGLICGEMQVSNLPVHVVLSAIVSHLSLDI